MGNPNGAVDATGNGALQHAVGTLSGQRDGRCPCAQPFLEEDRLFQRLIIELTVFQPNPFPIDIFSVFSDLNPLGQIDHHAQYYDGDMRQAFLLISLRYRQRTNNMPGVGQHTRCSERSTTDIAASVLCARRVRGFFVGFHHSRCRYKCQQIY